MPISEICERGRVTSVGIATNYRLNGRGIGIRFLAGARHFSVLHNTQTGSKARPASYTMHIRSIFPGSKAAGA